MIDFTIIDLDALSETERKTKKLSQLNLKLNWLQKRIQIRERSLKIFGKCMTVEQITQRWLKIRNDIEIIYATQQEINALNNQ